MCNNHHFEIDWIDLTPERSQQIIYCCYCYHEISMPEYQEWINSGKGQKRKYAIEEDTVSSKRLKKLNLN
jgi:hypothetical protein